MIYSDPKQPLRDTRRFLFCPKPAAALRLAIYLFIAAVLAEPAHGLMNYSLDLPAAYRKANSAIDIIYDGRYVWMATPQGVSATSDRGQTWITYDASNGLNASDISALAYGDGRLWVATAHEVRYGDQPIPWGDGFNLTTDIGPDWNWESSQPFQAADANMLAYDVAVLDSAAWATCFAGALIRSLDTGRTWHNIFASAADSIDFVDEIFSRRSNLYYSVVIDTFFQDSVAVWAGSAAGIHRFLYIDETRKLAGTRVLDVAYDQDTTLWLAADGGVSHGISGNSGYTYWFHSWDADQGLLGDYYTAIEADHDTIIAAAWDPELGRGLGFDISTSGGQSWYSSQPEQAVGDRKFVSEILKIDGTIFAACSEGGLIRSTDYGVTWEQLYPFLPGDANADGACDVDDAAKVLAYLSSVGGPPVPYAIGSGDANCDGIVDEADAEYILDFVAERVGPPCSAEEWVAEFGELTGDVSPDNSVNRFYSLGRESSDGSVSVWAGCDTGIVVFEFEDITGTARPWFIPFADTDTTGQHIESILVVDLVELDTFLVWDSDTVTKQIWIATHQMDGGATGNMIMRSIDRGASWDLPAQSAKAYDIALTGRTIRAGLKGAMLEGPNYGRYLSSYLTIYDQYNVPVDSIYRRIEPATNTYWVATAQGAARREIRFVVERVNTDQRKFDGHFFFDASYDGLSGDFITALGLQYHDGTKTIWAATQKTESGIDGITATTNDGADWIVRRTGVQVWNFAFDGGDVYFASTQGLFERPEGEDEFSKILVRESSGRQISDSAEFYSARVVGGDLWVGSSDGIAVMGVDTTIFRDFRSPEKEGGKPYASPVPVSPSKGLGFVRFHYYLAEPEYVTIRVYDFAMNLVRTVVDNEWREPRGELRQYDDDTWDLRNGRGDAVAAGVYFFLVETAGGQQDWGKLMVLP